MNGATAERRVIVVGAGVAGLSCATQLVQMGFHVTMIEARDQAGGRTFSFPDRPTGDEIDNGQHILMGCYTSTLAWLASLGTRHLIHVPDSPIGFVQDRTARFEWRLRRLPAPWHAVMAILQFNALGWSERLNALKVGLRLNSTREADTVAQWLERLDQSGRVMNFLWKPLCLAVMNEDPSTASARLFSNALRLMLFERRRYSDIFIPSTGLSRLMVEPSLRKICQTHGTVHFGRKIESIQTDGEEIRSVVSADGQEWSGDYFVVATPPGPLSRIDGMPAIAAGRASAIVSCYVWLDGPVAGEILPNEMTACVESPIHWIFRKSDRLVQLTTSAAGELAAMPAATAIRTLTDEFIRLFPGVGNRIVRMQIVKERNATTLTGGLMTRPGTATQWRNVFLAGDWIDTGLPCTIESAVRSGFMAAEAILRDFQKRNLSC